MIPPQDNPHGTLFNVMCPGENERYHNLMIFHDGSVNRNLKYKDVCPVAELESEPEYHHINIALTLPMREYPTSVTLEKSKDHPSIPNSWEILKIFFDHINIVPNWINCYRNWGWFDYETGKWTGAVRKVKFVLLSNDVGF